jgi:3'(2'), 5'-bisphosphate nucleotidase
MRAAVRGGAVARELQSGALTVERKADRTLVTDADVQAQEAIEAELGAVTPAIPIVSEEGSMPGVRVRRGWPRLWLVDPLDGTRDYVAGGTEFSVNVALIVAGAPRIGVVYVPVWDELFYGAVGWGAYRVRGAGAPAAGLEPGAGERLGRPRPRRTPVVTVSRTNRAPESQRIIDALRRHYGTLELLPLSSAAKLCLIAAGDADYYPRFGPTMEWDTAAGDALLRAVGGRIVQARTGRPLRYNKHDLHNPPFLAVGPGWPLPPGLIRG